MNKTILTVFSLLLLGLIYLINSGCDEAEIPSGLKNTVDVTEAFESNPNVQANQNPKSTQKAISPTGRGYLPSSTSKQRPSNMLKLTLQLTAEGIVTLNKLTKPNKMTRRSPHWNEPTFYRVVDSFGNTVFERGFKMETLVRGEYPRPDGVLEGHFFEIKQPIFQVSVPLFTNTDVIEFYRSDSVTSRADAELIGEVRP